MHMGGEERDLTYSAPEASVIQWHFLHQISKVFDLQITLCFKTAFFPQHQHGSFLYANFFYCFTYTRESANLS